MLTIEIMPSVDKASYIVMRNSKRLFDEEKSDGMLREERWEAGPSVLYSCVGKYKIACSAKAVQPTDKKKKPKLSS